MVTARIPADGPVRLGSVQLLDGRQLSDCCTDPPPPLLWATNDPVPAAPLVWQVLTGMHHDTGLVPILLAFMGGDHDGRPWDEGELDARCDVAAVGQLDAASVLAQAWAGKAPTPEEFEHEPEFFADWFPPAGSQFPGLAPGQDQELTEAGLDRALSWMLVRRPPRTLPDAQAVAAELYVMCDEVRPPGKLPYRFSMSEESRRIHWPSPSGQCGGTSRTGLALSAWESDRSGPLTALTWAADVPLVTVMHPAIPALMARQWPVA